MERELSGARPVASGRNGDVGERRPAASGRRTGRDDDARGSVEAAAHVRRVDVVWGTRKWKRIFFGLSTKLGWRFGPSSTQILLNGEWSDLNIQ